MIFKTADNQAPQDYLQIWDEADEPIKRPENGQLVLVLEDHTKEPMLRAVKQYLENMTQKRG